MPSNDIAEFRVVIGEGDFPASLRKHMRDHPDHELVTVIEEAAQGSSPGQLVGVTRRFGPETASEKH